MAFNPPIADNDIPSSAKWNTAVARYAAFTSTIDVVSSSSATAVLSQSIDAGHLSSDRLLRCTIIGDYLNNDGATRNLTLSIVFGATTLWADPFSSITNASTRRPIRWTFEIANLGAANSQFMAGVFWMGSSSAPTTGLGRTNGGNFTTTMNADLQHNVSFAGSASEDTTTAKTLTVNVQHSASSANLSFRKRYALLELV